MTAAEVVESLARLVAGNGWLALCTIDDDGGAAASYVPFAPLHGTFAIAVSGLAAHSRHLRARPEASVLLVDDRHDGDPFARSRLSVTVLAHFLESGGSRSREAWNALERAHGPTASVLRDLPDFSTVRLEPVAGRMVRGFADARDVDAGTLRASLAPQPDTGCASVNRRA